MSTSQLTDIIRIYIADGFYEDCEDLIQRCLKLEVLNFQTFCTIWKEMHFPSLYQELISSAEIAELSEEFVIVAKSFMIQDTGNYKQSMIGLFIVYALITQQPFPNFAYLPICPDDVTEIKRLEDAIRCHRCNDALLILGRVLVKHSRYTAVERERGFDITLIKYFNGSVIMNHKVTATTGIFSNINEEPDMLMELGTIARKYTKCRDRLNSNIKAGLNYVNANLPSQLSSSLKRLVKGYHDTSVAKDRSNTVNEIKQRAMKNAPDQLHYLITSEKKNEEPIKKCTSKVSQKLSSTDNKYKHIMSAASFISSISNDAEIIQKKGNVLNKVVKDLSLDAIDTSDGERIENGNRKRKNKEIDNVTAKVKKETIQNTNKRKGKRNPKGINSSDNIPHTDTKEVIPAVVHSSNGVTECEIEVIDYATDSTIPMHKVISDVIESADK